MAHRFIGTTIWHVYASLTPTAASNSSTTSGPEPCDCSVHTTIAVTLIILNAIAIVTFLWKRRQACQKLHSERPPDVVSMTDDSLSEYATVADIGAATEEEPNKAVVGASATPEVILVNTTYVSAGKNCLKSGTPSNISRNRLTPAEDRMPEKDELPENIPELQTPEQVAIDKDILGQETLYQNIPVLDTTVQETRGGDTLEHDAIDEGILGQETLYQNIPVLDTTVQEARDGDTLEHDAIDEDILGDETLYHEIPVLDTTVQEARDGDTLEQETVYHEIPVPDRTEQDVLDEHTLEQETPEMETLCENIPEIDTTHHNTLYNTS